MDFASSILFSRLRNSYHNLTRFFVFLTEKSRLELGGTLLSLIEVEVGVKDRVARQNTGHPVELEFHIHNQLFLSIRCIVSTKFEIQI